MTSWAAESDNRAYNDPLSRKNGERGASPIQRDGGVPENPGRRPAIRPGPPHESDPLWQAALARLQTANRWIDAYQALVRYLDSVRDSFFEELEDLQEELPEQDQPHRQHQPREAAADELDELTWRLPGSCGVRTICQSAALALLAPLLLARLALKSWEKEAEAARKLMRDRQPPAPAEAGRSTSV